MDHMDHRGHMDHRDHMDTRAPATVACIDLPSAGLHSLHHCAPLCTTVHHCAPLCTCTKLHSREVHPAPKCTPCTLHLSSAGPELEQRNKAGPCRLDGSPRLRTNGRSSIVPTKCTSTTDFQFQFQDRFPQKSIMHSVHAWGARNPRGSGVQSRGAAVSSLAIQDRRGPLQGHKRVTGGSQGHNR